MDKREMELLMDRYKKEMLEFSKKNGYINSDPDYKPDEREKQQLDADINNKGYERDRSNPLPVTQTDTDEKEDAREAVPAQASAEAEKPRNIKRNEANISFLILCGYNSQSILPLHGFRIGARPQPGFREFLHWRPSWR